MSSSLNQSRSVAGQGKATIGGIVAGPDGLYFTDLYPDLNFQDPTATGARILRVKYVGSGAAPISFSGDQLVGDGPLTVRFSDDSAEVGVTNWSWSFGDGGTSNLQNPTHVYNVPGVYDVTLSIVGPKGFNRSVGRTTSSRAIDPKIPTRMASSIKPSTSRTLLPRGIAIPRPFRRMESCKRATTILMESSTSMTPIDCERL